MFSEPLLAHPTEVGGVDATRHPQLMDDADADQQNADAADEDHMVVAAIRRPAILPHGQVTVCALVHRANPAHSGAVEPADPRANDEHRAAANNGEVGVHRSDIRMSLSGTATVTLTWPNGDFSLQLFITSGVCIDAAALLTGGCTILGSTRPGSLPGGSPALYPPVT